jgi:predicted metal-dependent phosphotriesterase family hydrolase
MADRDTHRGELRPDGTVLAFDRAGLRGYPPDAGQVCPAYTWAAR